ncbi:MAG: MaoC/PaaZ C-terminal domain-containing protein [Alphaproteobacteria bacterium]|nr:MaoC/PaaZ C-terminal domain-containing protein [Alphaproteobacteria bacterium]
MDQYYEDLAVGDVIDYGSYTTDKMEMIEFARRWDPRPFHVDEAYAAGTLYGEITASGVHTLAIFTNLCNKATGHWAVRGALGYEHLNFPAAVRAGDVVSGKSTVMAKRTSKSRPELGIITTRETMTNQRGETVLDFTVSFLVERRDGGPD